MVISGVILGLFSVSPPIERAIGSLNWDLFENIAIGQPSKKEPRAQSNIFYGRSNLN